MQKQLNASVFVRPLCESDSLKIGPRVVNVKAKRAARKARKAKNGQRRHMNKLAA